MFNFDEFSKNLLLSFTKFEKENKINLFLSNYLLDIKDKLIGFSLELNNNKLNISKIQNQYENKANSTITALEKLVNNIKESYNDYSKYKQTYIDIVIQSEMIKNELSKLSSGSNGNKILIEKYNTINSNKQVVRELLIYEIDNFNRKLSSFEKEYDHIKNEYKTIDTYLQSIYFSFDMNFASLSIDFGTIFNEIGSKINKYYKSSTSQITHPLILLSSNTEYVSFEKESIDNIFVNARKISDELSNENEIDNDAATINSLSSFSSHYLKNINKSLSLKMIRLENNEIDEGQSTPLYDKFINSHKQFLTEDLTEISILLWEYLISEKDVDIGFYNKSLTTTLLNPKFREMFIMNILENITKTNTYIPLSNYKNTRLLCNLLNSIVIQSFSKEEYFFLVSAVIFISERTFFLDQTSSSFINTTYLCEILAVNNFYNNKVLWKRVFYKEYQQALDKNYLLVYKDLFKKSNQSGKRFNCTIKKKSSRTLLALIDEERISDNNKKVEEQSKSMKKNSGGGFFNIIKRLIKPEENRKKNEDEEREKEEEDDEVFEMNSIRKEKLNENGEIFKKNKKNFYLKQKTSILQGFIYLDNNENHVEQEEEANNEEEDIIKLKKIMMIEKNPSKTQKKILEKVKNQQSSEIIKMIINNFFNFNVDYSNSIEFVFEISKELNFSKEYMNLFVSLLKTSTYSIKNKYSLRKSKISFISTKFTNVQNDKTIHLLQNSLQYLPFEDMFNLRITNKLINSKLEKRFFSVFLSNLTNQLYSSVNLDEYEFYNSQEFRLNMKKIINIWKILLKTEKIKKDVNYKEIISYINLVFSKNDKSKHSFSVERSDSIDLSNHVSYSSINDEEILIDKYSYINLRTVSNMFNIIDLDVKRTQYSDDVQQNRKVLENILKSYVIAENTSCYCQGMNFIVYFLQLLTGNDEEETFYLFLSLNRTSEFNDTFHSDFEKLKQFFYSVDRIISLYLPQLNSCLYKNNIGSGTYCSTWFTTLFTYNFKNNDENLNFLTLKIWNDFIIYGFYSIFKTALLLFKYNENNILSLPNDEILSYLFNNLISSGVFSNKNFISSVNLLDEIYLPYELMVSLQNEYVIYEKLNVYMEEQYGN